MMKILLTGHGGSLNRGCEALILCTTKIIFRHLGNIQLTVLSSDAESDCSIIGKQLPEIQFLTGRPVWLRRWSTEWLLSVLYRRVLRRWPYWLPLVPRLHQYRGYQMVIHIGGDNLTGMYADTWLAELALSRSLGARTVIWAASIGPFPDQVQEKWARELKKVDLITVREALTIQYLKKIGVTDNVRRVADPAFLLSAQANSIGGFRLSKREKLLGIGMSAHLAYHYGTRYLNAFARFGRFLLLNDDIHLLLVPHVAGKHPTQNDIAVCQSLAAKLANKDRVTILSYDYNASQIKYVISQCDYFVGARTHSTIASLSSCVPTVTIAYSPKAYGINKDTFGHTDYVVPVEDLSEESLMAVFTRIREDDQKITQLLKRRLPDFLKMADLGGVYLAEMLDRPDMVGRLNQ